MVDLGRSRLLSLCLPLVRRMKMKKPNLMLRGAFGAVFFCFAANALFGQACKEMTYGHENQVDPKPIELNLVHGVGLEPSGGVIQQLCVGIFSEPEHKLVRYAQTDTAGAFALETSGLPDREYRLVGQVPGFCPANAIIKLNSHSRRKKSVVVHMDVKGIDS